jgi:protein sidekick
VTGLKVVPITTTSVRVEWDTVDSAYWSGDYETGGYRVEYRSEKFPTAVQATPKEDVMGTEVSLPQLESNVRPQLLSDS